MSLRSNIDQLRASQGTVAVAVERSDLTEDAVIFRGDPGWTPILTAVLRMAAQTEVPAIRVMVKDHTIAVLTVHWPAYGVASTPVVTMTPAAFETVAVVVPTGHTGLKSLMRKLRASSKGAVPRRPKVAAGTSRTVGPKSDPDGWMRGLRIDRVVLDETAFSEPKRAPSKCPPGECVRLSYDGRCSKCGYVAPQRLPRDVP